MRDKVLEAYVDGHQKFNVICSILYSNPSWTLQSKSTMQSPEGILRQLEDGLKTKSNEVTVCFFIFDERHTIYGPTTDVDEEEMVFVKK